MLISDENRFLFSLPSRTAKRCYEVHINTMRGDLSRALYCLILARWGIAKRKGEDAQIIFPLIKYKSMQTCFRAAPFSERSEQCCSFEFVDRSYPQDESYVL